MSDAILESLMRSGSAIVDSIIENYDPAITVPHKIGGFVTVDGSPAKKRVMAFNRKTGVLLRTTFSDKDTGKWEMRGMFEAVSHMPTDPKQILVVAVDDGGDFNGEIFDFITRKADEVEEV